MQIRRPPWGHRQRQQQRHRSGARCQASYLSCCCWSAMRAWSCRKPASSAHHPTGGAGIGDCVAAAAIRLQAHPLQPPHGQHSFSEQHCNRADGACRGRPPALQRSQTSRCKICRCRRYRQPLCSSCHSQQGRVAASGAAACRRRSCGCGCHAAAGCADRGVRQHGCGRSHSRRPHQVLALQQFMLFHTALTCRGRGARPAWQLRTQLDAPQVPVSL